MSDEIELGIGPVEDELRLSEIEPEFLDLQLVQIIEVGGKPLPDLAVVALTGDYDDLTDKPFIPTAASQIGGVMTEAGKRLMTSQEGDKLAAIAPGATVNSADSFLLDRSNHTGAQPLATVTGLVDALASKVPVEAGKVLSSNDYSNAEKLKLANVAIEATKNSTDDFLLDRTHHTGVQAISTISGLQAVLNAKVDVVAGKQLSTNDYTDQDKAQIAANTTGISGLQTSKVDKVAGKALSTNDYTDLEKTKLAGLSNFDPSVINQSVTALQDGKVDKVAGKQLSTEDYTTAEKVKLAGLSNFDPSALTAAITSLQDNKVDKVNGKSLSTNDYSDAEKVKLTGIAAGATANQTDAYLRSRANHTGTQGINTVTGLQTALDAKQNAETGKGLSANDYTDDDKALVDGFVANLNTKVDKVEGYGLSSTDFTAAEKAKLAAIEGPMFRGTFPTLSALNAGVTAPQPGNYADVDVAGQDAIRYLWDSTDSQWIASTSSSSPITAAQVKDLYEDNPDTNAYTDAEKDKLLNITPNATRNLSNVQLLDRTNHTGTQAVSTIDGLQALLDAKVDKISGSALMTAAQSTKLAGIAANATQNDTDANLKNRANHTGTQGTATISGLDAFIGATQSSLSDLATNKVDKVNGLGLSQNSYSTTEQATVRAASGFLSDTLPGMQTAIATNASALVGKVDKVSGKGLSTNDYDNTAVGLVAQLPDLFNTYIPQNDQNLGFIVNALLNKVDKDGTKVLSSNDYTNTEKTKLANIEEYATLNSSDAALINRANHTGTQSITTVEGLRGTLDTKVDKVTGFALSSNDFTTAEKTKLGAIAAGATVNSADAVLLARANHTGVQAISTVSGLQAALDTKVGAYVNPVLLSTDYTMTAADSGKAFLINNGLAQNVILTFPASLPDGFNVKVYEANDGHFIFDFQGRLFFSNGQRQQTGFPWDKAEITLSTLAGTPIALTIYNNPLPTQYSENTSAITRNTTAFVNVDGMALTLEENSIYDFKMHCVFQTTNTAQALKFGFADFTSGAIAFAEYRIAITNAAGTSPYRQGFIAGSTALNGAGTASVVGVNHLGTMMGRIKTGTAPLILTPTIAAQATTGNLTVAQGLMNIVVDKVRQAL